MQAAVDNLTFEEWWAELAGAVRAWLLRRRVPPHLVDDIVQETGLRLFKMWDEIDAMRSPRGLAFTIASNLLWDERNRRAAREVVGDVPEESREDVERAGIARLELARVRRAMKSLNPQQRAVLLAEIGDGSGPDASPDAIKMMRMRARRRLTALLDSAPVGLFVFARMPRRLWKAFRTAPRSAAVQVPALAVVAACTTIAVIGVPPTQPLIDARIDTVASVEVVPTAAAAAARDVEGTVKTAGPTGRAPSGGGSAGAGTTDHRVSVAVGEGTPVNGEATVGVRDGEEFGIQPPDCSVEPSGNEVHVRCSAQAGDKRVEADTVLSVDP